MITSDLHLGHKNICKFRTQFTDEHDHHMTVFENLATSIGKRDSVYFLGDIAFNPYWLMQIAKIKCVKKTLILGNHDTKKMMMKTILMAFDSVYSLQSKRNVWFSHCPIHTGQFRGKILNIHGHLHDKKVQRMSDVDGSYIDDSRYFNACVEHTNYKPISFSEIIERQIYAPSHQEIIKAR